MSDKKDIKIEDNKDKDGGDIEYYMVWVSYQNFCTMAFAEHPAIFLPHSIPRDEEELKIEVRNRCNSDDSEELSKIAKRQLAHLPPFIDRTYTDEFRGDHTNVYYIKETNTIVIAVGLKSDSKEIVKARSKIRRYFNTPYNTIITCNPKKFIEVDNPIKIDYENPNEDIIKECLLLMHSYYYHYY